MKRVLCAALLGAAALTTVPAHAAEDIHVVVTHYEGEDGVFVGVGYTRDNGSGPRYTPIGGAGVNTKTATVCAGLSYQVPQCVGGPIN